MIISMSPDAYVTAVAMGRSLGIFNTENGNLEELLEEVHGGNTGAVLPSCHVLWYLIHNLPSWEHNRDAIVKLVLFSVWQLLKLLILFFLTVPLFRKFLMRDYILQHDKD